MKRFIYWYHKIPDWAKLAILSQIPNVAIHIIQWMKGYTHREPFFYTSIASLSACIIPFGSLRLTQYFAHKYRFKFFTSQISEFAALILSVIPLAILHEYLRYFAKMLGILNPLDTFPNPSQISPKLLLQIQSEFYKLDFTWEHLVSNMIIGGSGLFLIAIVRAGYKTKHYIESAEQAEQLAQLKAQNTRSHLRALQARINPHFLYNALNNIAGLTHEKPDQAEQMAVSLATLFREALNKEEQDYSTVEQELEIIQHYLTIEKIRFGDALQYQIDVQPNTRSKHIPRFLLQPLVENAIKHGVEPDGKGRIRVNIEGDDSKLVISVEDSGKPFPDPIEGGYGLQNVQDNLELLFPNRHTIELKNATETQAKQIRLTLEMTNIAQVRAQYIAPQQ
jgi:signal transduction histidine kinase